MSLYLNDYKINNHLPTIFGKTVLLLIVAEPGCPSSVSLAFALPEVGGNLVNVDSELCLWCFFSAEVIVLLFVSGARGSRLLNHGCRSAWAGVMRCDGSHSRHLLRKSTNAASSHPFKAWTHDLDDGGPRVLPCRERPPVRTELPSGKVVTVQ